jgi:hypothetical protein
MQIHDEDPLRLIKEFYEQPAVKKMYGDGSDGSYTLDGIQPAVAGLFSKQGNTYHLLRKAQFVDLIIRKDITLFTYPNILRVQNPIWVDGVLDVRNPDSSGNIGGSGI